VNYANAQVVGEQMKGSLQVQPGVVVANQHVMGRLTQSINGTPGVMSRNHPTNAVAMQGGDKQSFQRLATE